MCVGREKKLSSSPATLRPISASSVKRILGRQVGRNINDTCVFSLVIFYRVYDPPLSSFRRTTFASLCVAFQELAWPQTTKAVVRGVHAQRDASPIIPPEIERGFVCVLPCGVLPSRNLITFQLPPPPRARCPPLLQSEWISSSTNLILALASALGTLRPLRSFKTGGTSASFPVL